MPPNKLPLSVLLALGLGAAGCDQRDLDTGPCLSLPDADTDADADADSDSDADADTDADSDADTDANSSRESARDRVLKRGVLPDDVRRRLED